MPTYAQLQAESWWGREIVTPELDQFGEWVRAYFRLPADAIGNKGNNVHLYGSHRSQEWIKRSRYCTNRTSTVQAGLTAEQERHIAGVDITPNTTADMLAISQRIDRETRAGRLEEVVAWYGNVNGDKRVDGFDNIRNVAATSDSSHLWHLHLGIDRRVLRDLAAMRRIFNVLTNQTQGVTVASVLTGDEQRRLRNVDEYAYGIAGELDPLPNITGGGGAVTPVPNLPLRRAKSIEDKVDQLLARPAGGPVTPSPEQWAALTADIRGLLEQLFAEKVGQAAELGAEAAVRRVLGAVDGAVPPPPANSVDGS